ncbi:enoyl-CoA hydratase/isomerase family protein [Amycolatopsis acidiphila]|uniref:Enoyl-CoA hydratase/isomerase family protein n=1 Tax=Amycolatopsis acidiphila TaxID=715473 RepID=A0A558AHV3_9PSEU|nr:enoyl-CoA hydratase/isomerase family protein [Amycolatopsis acidiphila]TVT23840.1 enoyl-CoA hydratase/isomerase family protein [Amycolatopsis acidiphila]UIJ61184.1 enoyl-CoA hydratase/isomerase family protein [Amycolatopsis acidiphila]GHG86242.1 enoyl-CoA hydratase [Amycolatopsis acidiphila]
MTQFDNIKSTVKNGVGTITFDRLDRRNALSVELMADLSDQLDEWAYDDEVAAVVLTGGEDVFCAGLDLDLQSGFTQETRSVYSDACLRAYSTLLDYRKPTIAAVGGPALGGGCDIAVFTDIRVGSDNAIFGYPQIKFGLTPYFSPLWRIVGLSQAKLLTFSGDKVDAAEALRIGLIDRPAPKGEVVARATALAASIAETTVKSAVNNKEMARTSPGLDPINALTYETLAYREVIWHPDIVARINDAYSRIKRK